MNDIVLTPTDIKIKSVAIVRLGPPTLTSGFTPGQYYQVTIDPDYVSPSGDYIRFGDNQGDELSGWQRVSAITVCEVLGQWDGRNPPDMVIGKDKVTLPVITP